MDLSRRFGGKKFMWDGRPYPTEEEAQKTAQEYQEKGFMVEVVSEDKQYYLFTRREIKEVVVEGKP